MVADTALIRSTPSPDASRIGQALGAKARRSKLVEIVAMQDLLMQVVLGNCVQQGHKLLLVDVPARERAQCASAWDKLEHRRREALGKASLAPVKSESRSRSRSTRLRVEPVESPAAMPAIQPPGESPS